MPLDYDKLFLTAQRLAAERPRGRYAPSPTGPLHLGNLRTALLAWLQTRLCGGAFVLRIEDLDQPRVKPESLPQLVADLRWLGVDWDEGPDVGGPLGPYDQAARIRLYEHALNLLHVNGRVFPCFCSRKDLQEAASAPHGIDGSPVYPGTCRDERNLKPKDRPPAWRYRAPSTAISFVDEIAGCYAQTLHAEVGDFVVRRADCLFAYQLAVVVDDALMGITDVVRGADLLSSTPRQIELQRALGFPRPRYWHVPLVRDAGGERLAKRSQAQSLNALRERGLQAADVVGQLASGLGLVPPGSTLSAGELLEETSLTNLREALRNEYLRAETGGGNFPPQRV